MACNLLECLFLHWLHPHSSPSSSMLSFAILGLYNSSMRSIVQLIYLCSFLGSSGESAWQVSPYLPLPTVLTHFSLHKLYSVFPPPLLMSSKLFQVFQKYQDACKPAGEYLLSSPISWSVHPPLISYPRPTKCSISIGGFYWVVLDCMWSGLSSGMSARWVIQPLPPLWQYWHPHLIWGTITFF